MRHWFAGKLRRWADRIDKSAPEGRFWYLDAAGRVSRGPSR